MRGRISIVFAFTFFIRLPIRLGKSVTRRCAQRPRRDKCPKIEGRPPRFDYVLQHAARGRGSIARAQNIVEGLSEQQRAYGAQRTRGASS